MASCTAFVSNAGNLRVARHQKDSGKTFICIGFDDDNGEMILLHSPSRNFLEALQEACSRALNMDVFDEVGSYDIEIED